MAADSVADPHNVNLHTSKLRNEVRLSLGIVAALALVPAFVHSPYWLGVLILTMYFAIVTSGWNLLAGYAGQFSLAPAPFAMLGGYATGVLAFKMNAPLWIGLPMSIVVPGLVGLVLGRIVLRQSGVYLALTTLAFGEVMRVVASNWIDVTRGDQGLSVPTLTYSYAAYYYMFLATLAATVGVLYCLLRAPLGRFLQAIRDDEIGAASRGIDLVFYKTIAFAISCAVCGFAGGLYGTFSQLVSPELGIIEQTGLVIAMAVIGGMGTLAGPLIGAILVYITSQLLQGYGTLQMIGVALLVIIFARFFQAGLWGLLRRLLVRRSAH